MIRGVFFDLMGTLLVAKTDRQSDGILHLYRQLERFGLTSSEEEFLSIWISTPARKVIEGSLTPFEDRIARTAMLLGIEVEQDRLSILAQEVCNRSATFLTIDPEAELLLQKLSREFIVGLITNYDHPPHIYRLLGEFCLQDYFETIVISGELGIWKPDPGIIEHALGAIAVSANESVYIGDSIVDYEAAKEAGVTSVIILRESERGDPFRETDEDDGSRRFHELADEGMLKLIESLSALPGLLHRSF